MCHGIYTIIKYITAMLEYANQRKGNKRFINGRMICRVLGVLLMIEVLMFLGCAGVSWFYAEGDAACFLWSAAITTAAAGLLVQEGMTPLEASLSAGFSNLSYFYREFRKAYGMTPSQYRRIRNSS